MNKNLNDLTIDDLNVETVKKILGEREFCELDPETKCTYCGECLLCDLDPTKICNNCGACLDQYKTDEKGYVSIKVDKIINDDKTSLDDLYSEYGLNDDQDVEITLKDKNNK